MRTDTASYRCGATFGGAPLRNDSRPEAFAVSPRDRIDSIDAVRGAALFGVLIVNLLTAFRVSMFAQFVPAEGSSTGLDRLVETFMWRGLEMKAFSLFSILFGVGLAIQFERLSRGERAHYFLTRRLVVLLAFGLIHLFLIWNGDILTEYALAGLLVLPLLWTSRCALAVLATALLGLYAVLTLLPSMAPLPNADDLRSHIALANQIYAQGSYLEVVRFNAQEVALYVPLHANIFPRTVALFTLGAFIWRTQVLKNATEYRHSILAVAMGALVVGILFTLAANSPEWRREESLFRNFAPIALAIGYGAALIWMAQIPSVGRLLSPLAAAGRMAFSNYILQSVIFGFIFYGYGLAQFGRMSASSAFLLGVIVYLAQAVLSAIWLRRFRFGPLEWLWRTLMYNRAQPMRRG